VGMAITPHLRVKGLRNLLPQLHTARGWRLPSGGPRSKGKIPLDTGRTQGSLRVVIWVDGG